MQNFDYRTPTRLVFGRGAIKNLPAALARYGRRVLFAYGGGSIKRSGLYGKVLELLKDFEVYELPDIAPNPKYTSSVLVGVKICKEKNIDAVLAVGGGSVLDCAKAICAGACYDGEPWDLITYKAKAQRALPLVDVLTLAATGSEYDNCCVISRTETNDKKGYKDDLLYPAVSLLDPEYTYGVSKRQTAAGTADAISHVLEQFFCGGATALTDGLCFAVIKSLMKNVEIALANPDDYAARAELMAACALACNGILSIGTEQRGWACHGIEHALSAYYDVTHGEGLAIITPVWMRHILNEKTLPRFVSYGVNIFGTDSGLAPMQIAETAITSTYDFFKSLGLPMRLRDIGIDGSRLEEMARHVAETERPSRYWFPLTERDILTILKNSL